MSETTKNLKLFKYNTTSDANVPFSIDNALNANWDILDENWSKGSGVLPGFLYKVTGLIDESENIFRYANGQVITEDDSVSGLSSFLDKQEKLGADIFCTELEWQNIKNTSKLGQVGKYVRDKSAGTVRLPLILNEQGLADLANCGMIKAESLPNVKGSCTAYGIEAWNGGGEGALQFTVTSNTGISHHSGNQEKRPYLTFDASRSSSTYQDDAPVQQEAIQYPYVICVNSGVEEAEKPISNYQVNNVYSFGMSQYYKGTMNNASWLRSEGQWNAGTVYTDLYTWIQTQITNKVDGFKLSTATGITDYDWVINTTNQTFRLPLKNGQEGVFASGYNLYYYVGDTLQNVDIMNVARIEEALVDVNSSSRGYLVESYINGLSGYRLYSDGYCEQWGNYTGGATSGTITLLKGYKHVESYSIITQCHFDTSHYGYQIGVFNKSINGFRWASSGSNYKFNWLTSGYIR